jgi:TonB family protein
MKTFISLLTLIITGSSIVAAQDTLYLNNEWKPANKPKNAVYRQVITNTDTGYVVNTLNRQNQLESKSTYKDGYRKILHGYSATYAGKHLGSEGRYVEGKQEGLWKYYHQDGAVSAVVTYKDNKRESASYFKPDGQPETDLQKAEHLPSFPGGSNAWGTYLVKNLRYPPEALKTQTSGQVRVEFTVTATGEIRDIIAVSGPSEELKSEAMRVVRMMPGWNPGVQFNRPVKVRYTMPISFRIR